MSTLAAAVQQAVAAVCAVVGVHIVNPSDQTTWSADYPPGATCEAQGNTALLAFDLAAWNAKQAAQTQIDTAIAAGLSVTSASAPSVSGVYGLQQGDQQALMAAQLAISVGQSPQMPYIDSTGAVRTLTNTQIVSLAQQAYAYLGALTRWAAGGGQGAMPSNGVSIP